MALGPGLRGPGPALPKRSGLRLNFELTEKQFAQLAWPETASFSAKK